ncbi:MAG TPA: hypothetical protein VFE46_01090 [Pirellulales bacterium]|nr:hypothetical protein [Pirellulales bacterium]
MSEYLQRFFLRRRWKTILKVDLDIAPLLDRREAFATELVPSAAWAQQLRVCRWRVAASQDLEQQAMTKLVLPQELPPAFAQVLVVQLGPKAKRPLPKSLVAFADWQR